MCRNAWCGTPIASPRSLVLGTVVMTTGCIMACVAVLRILGSGLQPLCQPQRMPQLLRAVNTSTTGIESLALQCDLEQTSSDDCVQCKMTADGLYYIQIRPFQITRDAAEEFYEAWEKYHYEFRLLVLNELSEPTSLHAHGLNPPNGQDGVAYITEPPIPPGEEREYRFRAQVGGGSFWLHAHSGLHAGLGLWIPLVLQHPSQEIQKLGNPRELILMAEDQFVHPYCAYRPFLYPEKCQHLLTTEHTKVAYYLNRRTSPQVVRCSAGEKFMLRLGNAGTEATWHFNLSWFSNAMLLALDGNNVQRAHMVDTKEHAIILSSAQRTDVLVQVPGSGCYPIIVSSGSHAGEEQHPVSRVLFLDASEVPEPCAPPEFPRFMPAYSRFSRLTPARYPMKKHKIMRNLSWEISVGEQFGGFAGNCYAGEQIHLCREYKWPLPPSRSWQHVETGYMVPRVVLSIVSMYECPS